MLPDFTVLVGLLLGFMSLHPGLTATPGRALAGTALCLLVGGAASRMAAQRGCRAVQEDDLLTAMASARWTTLWPLVAWIVALWLFQWGSLVDGHVPRITWIVRYAVLLAPAALLFAIGWSSRWQVESKLVTAHGGVPSSPSARGAVRAGFRRNAAAFLPLFVLIGITEGIWVAGQLGVEPLRVAARWLDHMPLLNLGVFLGLLLLALPFFPRWIARMLGAKPLPDGPLRRRLEAGIKAIGLQVGHILVWPTQRRILNAMVVGVTRRSRTIVLSDRIIAELPEDELMAVFFHEAGHAKLQHLVLYLLMFITLIGLTYAVEDHLLLAGLSVEWIIILQMAVFWFVLLGSISRRFEREADVFGAEHAAPVEGETPAEAAPGMLTPVPRGPALMMRALDHIRKATGGGGPSHRHGTLEDRISYIGAYATDPEVRASFRKTNRGLRVGIVIALAVCIGAVVNKWPAELQRAQAAMQMEAGNEAVERAQTLVRSANRTEARTHWRAAYDAYRGAAGRIGEDPSHPGDGRRLATLHVQAANIALDELDDPDNARAGFERAERALKRLEAQPTVGGETLESLAFHTWIGSARVAARQERFDVADDYVARAARSEQKLAVSRETTSEFRSWNAELLRLARAAVAGHAAAAAGQEDGVRLARRHLRLIIGGSDPSPRWVSLREAAQHELDLLPVPDDGR